MPGSSRRSRRGAPGPGRRRDSSGDRRRPRARSRVRSRHRAAGRSNRPNDPRWSADAFSGRSTASAPSALPRSRAIRATASRPVAAPSRSSAVAISSAAARSGAGAGRTRYRRSARRYSLAGRPAPGSRPAGQAPVLGQKQARIHEAIEVECRELTADPHSRRGLVAADRLVPRDDELVQAAPRRLGEHCCDLDRVDVRESVGHGTSVTARFVMKRLDMASDAV